MFRLPSGTEITTSILDEFIQEHKKEVTSRYKPLMDAYKSDHKILHADNKPEYKPDNRIVVNFPKYIVDTMNGFFIGNPIKVIADDPDVAEYVDYLDQYNDQDDNNAELSKIMSIYGKGYEMYYANEDSELCITYLSPEEAFMIYDDSIIERPMAFVRIYKDWEDNEFGSISDKYGVRHFQISGEVKWLEGEETGKSHGFADVPATEYIENAERQGLFEPVMSIVDAYNKAVSEKANDVDYFADAYMKILGVALDEEGVQHIRNNRIINFEGDDAGKIVVEFMGKPESDTTQENHLNRLERLIFQISMVANISDENFGGSSGIALRYKLQAMSNLEKTKERKFTSGMNRRYKVLFSHPLAKVPEDAWVQLHFKFTPNIPANLLEESQIAAALEGIVSQETQLKVLSVVDDIQAELDRIEEENTSNEEDPIMSTMFGNTATEETPIIGAEEVTNEQQGILE